MYKLSISNTIDSTKLFVFIFAFIYMKIDIGQLTVAPTHYITVPISLVRYWEIVYYELDQKY